MTKSQEILSKLMNEKIEKMVSEETKKLESQLFWGAQGNGDMPSNDPGWTYTVKNTPSIPNPSLREGDIYKSQMGNEYVVVNGNYVPLEKPTEISSETIDKIDPTLMEKYSQITSEKLNDAIRRAFVTDESGQMPDFKSKSKPEMYTPRNGYYTMIQDHSEIKPGSVVYIHTQNEFVPGIFPNILKESNELYKHEFSF